MISSSDDKINYRKYRLIILIGDSYMLGQANERELISLNGTYYDLLVISIQFIRSFLRINN